MSQESLASEAEKGLSPGPKTPSPSKGGVSRSPEETPLVKEAGTTRQDTLDSARHPATVSATQASSYATTKSVGQIALGTSLIAQVSWAAHARRPLRSLAG